MSAKPHARSRAAPFRTILGMLLLLSVLATPALAHNRHRHHRDWDRDCGPTIGAPEIDPGSMLGGLTLLVGGAFLLADRRRRHQPQVGFE